jgi:hypothetical protein
LVYIVNLVVGAYGLRVLIAQQPQDQGSVAGADFHQWFVQNISRIDLELTQCGILLGKDPAKCENPAFGILGCHADKEAEEEAEAEAKEVGHETKSKGNSEEQEPVVYPNPTLHIAARWTWTHVPGTKLIKAYGATDLILALATCLWKHFEFPGHSYPLYDSFDVLHCFHLCQATFSFAPLKPRQQEVVRIKPPS